MGRNTDALVDCDKAVEIEPDYAGAHMGRGNALLRLDRPADALDSYRLAARADPSSAAAHIAAGKIHESQGRPADAFDSYSRAAGADPSNVVAYMVAGEINEGLDNLPESMGPQCGGRHCRYGRTGRQGAGPRTQKTGAPARRGRHDKAY